MSILGLRYVNFKDGLKLVRCFASKAHPVGSFETNMGANGPLVDGPDYTFIDGRKTPLRSGQKNRLEKQLKASNKILQLMQETKFAIDSHKNKQIQEKRKRQVSLESKLKIKSHKKL